MPIQNRTEFSLRKFLYENKYILIVILFLIIERLFALYSLGFMYSLESDDLSYINSGIVFAKTGMITMHDSSYPSAQIMPGMTVFIGILSLVLGEGKALWIVLKLIWILIGSLTAWYIYKSVNLYAAKWCGILATLPLFLMNYVWMDNLILTETPFLFLLTAMIYYTLSIGKNRDWKSFWGCAVSYMLALLLKANIAPYPIFALIYLFVLKYDFKRLLCQSIILACIVSAFLIPWSIRNYKQFGSFIPLTYGAGNPTLLGTYQGKGYPLDEDLDYKVHVDDVLKEKYIDCYDESGQPKAQYVKYLSLRKDEIKANYRIREWLSHDWKSFIFSYLFLKPIDMIRSVFYWDTVLGVEASRLLDIQFINALLCVAVVVSSLILKKRRSQVLYLALLYMGNIMIYAMTFSFDRYNASLMSIRFILVGIGFGLLVDMCMKAIKQSTSRAV